MADFLTLPWTPHYTQAPAEAAEEPSLLAYWSLAATIAFTVAVYTLEGSLDARQKGAYQATEFPDELKKTVSEIDKTKGKSKDGKDAETPVALLPQLEAKFVKSQIYGLDKINFGMIAGTYDMAESVIFLLLGFLPYAWDLAVQYGSQWFEWTEQENEIKISLLFFAIVTVVGTITSLPFELYSTFQIERKHGFNKQTMGLFFSDKIKTLLLTCVIGGPFVSLLLYIIKAGGEYFYLYVWAFMFVFSVFMMTIVSAREWHLAKCINLTGPPHLTCFYSIDCRCPSLSCRSSTSTSPWRMER
jgi:STE24 endopeptidase